MTSGGDGLQDGFVLAGGASRRMGFDKALLEYRGRTLLDWSIDILERAGLGVRVIADRGNRFPHCTADVLIDEIPGAGPLSGLDTALSACSGEFAFILPCDMPLVDPDLFVRMRAQPPQWDIVIPVDDQLHGQFLCGRYSVRCQAPLRELIKKGDYRVGRLSELPELQVARISIEDLGLPACIFQNVNRPEDVEALP